MSWVRQHCEAGKVVMVARVAVEGKDHTVQLIQPQPPGESGRIPWSLGTSYATRDLAFAAADALVRQRLNGHTCNPTCSGWADAADTR